MRRRRRASDGAREGGNAAPAARREPTDLRRRPTIIAHRGLSGRAPENTLAAFRMALEVGADACECDVHLSADRVPVVVHDESLLRTAGLDARVSELTAAELRRLDAGSWMSPAFAGERIPTLAELLELLRGRAPLLIEVKSTDILPEVVEVIRRSGARPDDVAIISFHRGVVAAAPDAAPGVRTGLLFEKLPADAAGRDAVIADALAARAAGIGTEAASVDARFVQAAHQHGLLIYVWTVNDAETARGLAGAGVDGLISDWPDLIRATLDPA